MNANFPLFLMLQCLSGRSASQQVGTHLLQETHPTLKIQRCTSEGVCLDKVFGITLDADMRPLQENNGISSCASDKAWNTTICSNSEVCAENCGLGGVKYKSVHGIMTHGHNIKLRLFKHGKLKESRVYLMDKNKYKVFYLKNREFAFDIDASDVPCGVNAALYFTSMSADGSLSSRNRAGATYGTGYCDAQCPTSLRFVDGKANLKSYKESGNRTSRGMGACCAELDLWEGNALAHAYTAHPCGSPGMTICDDKDCQVGAGLCDRLGCSIVSQGWRGNNLNGTYPSVDTTSKYTVVTQFLTSDGTSHGQLVEIKQFYVQKGVLLRHRRVELNSTSSFDSITEQFCLDSSSIKVAKTSHAFHKGGGLESMGRAMDGGMVLVMSLWTGEMTDNLGSIQKVSATKINNASSYEKLCPQHSASRPFIQKHYPHASVTFSNIKFGPINSTYSIASTSRPPPASMFHTTV